MLVPRRSHNNLGVSRWSPGNCMKINLYQEWTNHRIAKPSRFCELCRGARVFHLNSLPFQGKASKIQEKGLVNFFQERKRHININKFFR